MLLLLRAITYSVLFAGLVLIYVPARLLARVGIIGPAIVGFPQVGGLAIGTVGGLLVVWCISTFVFVGRGTPAPFDPPRELVVRGPYRFVRNPMYIGAALALAGAAAYFQSWQLLGYAGLFLLAAHLLVIVYEEPVLRQTFGASYETYCGRVRRWWPKL
jgi:protein-S-isoprenylcysteine O-methyltransferase Ste14